MDTILMMLSSEQYVSGERLSETLGVTRAAVWKRIHALQDAGWPIESAGKRGYRLCDHDRLEPETWQHLLKTSVLGRGEVRYAQTLTSTNDELKRMAVSGAPHGSIALCEQQTAGRGRLGRVWQSPAGCGLWQSVLARPDLPPAKAPAITFCAALAMCRTLRGFGMDARIKWPNDLVCGGKKLVGILLESASDMDRIEYVVIGVGLNVLPGSVPPDLTGQAACAADFITPPKRRQILADYLFALEETLDALQRGGWEALAEEYRRLCVTLGARVRVSGAEEFTGIAEEMDDEGALLVRGDGDGILRRVMAGDVSVRGMMGYV